jgi:hypothetical protein
MEGETGGHATWDGYKIVFKILDCFFCLVVPVVVRRYELVSHLVELDLLREKC